MKKTANNFRMTGVVLCIAAASSCLSQTDTIFKTNGDIIPCKVIEVGTNGVSYKKASFIDGPSFVDMKEDIVLLKFSNGQKQEFAKTPAKALDGQPKLTIAEEKNNKPLTKKEEEKKAAEKKAEEKKEKVAKGPISDQYKIIFDGKKYYVNGQKIGQKDVDRLLSRSTNPAVAVPLKTAKLTKTFQKITKWTAFPSTISGGIGSIATFNTLYQQLRNGPASADSYVNFGLSFLGTLSLPITAKLLKKSQTKLYDKTIDLYNLDKQ